MTPKQRAEEIRCLRHKAPFFKQEQLRAHVTIAITKAVEAERRRIIRLIKRRANTLEFLVLIDDIKKLK